MELLLATGVGVLTAVGIYLALRAQTFPLVLGLTFVSYAVNLFIFAMGRLEVGLPPIISKSAEALLHSLTQSMERLLTPRQTQILQLVAEGLTNREIAQRLGLSERTVDRHVSDTLTRIDVPTRAAATAFAISHGLIVLPSSG